MRKTSVIVIAALLLLTVFSFAQAAASQQRLTKKLNNLIVKADHVRQTLDLNAIADPKVKKALERLSNAIKKAENARQVLSKVQQEEEAEELLLADASSTGSLSSTAIKKVMPGITDARINSYLSHLNDAMAQGGISTCLRQSAFLAQLGHESLDLRYMEEIASGAAYEGRKDLGNIYPGDGVRYKGRGPIQLTGRSNYRTAGQALGVDLEGNPTLAATPQWGFKVAAWYWTTRGLNAFADQNNQGAFDTITRRINGGTNGKADRDRYWYKAKSVLGC